MIASILSAISGIVTIVNWILGRVSQQELIKQGRDQITLAALQKDSANAVQATQVDTAVAAAPLSELEQRMLKYKRPGA